MACQRAFASTKQTPCPSWRCMRRFFSADSKIARQRPHWQIHRFVRIQTRIFSAKKVSMLEEDWRVRLSPEQFRILRQKGTEAPFSGEYDKFYPKAGVFVCAGCNAPLFTASSKFDSGCGWPAFFENIPGAVNRQADHSFGQLRTEITCASCGGHLGHVFQGEGYRKSPADERHCVNSISIKFKDDES